MGHGKGRYTRGKSRKGKGRCKKANGKGDAIGVRKTETDGVPLATRISLVHLVQGKIVRLNYLAGLRFCNVDQIF